MTAKTKKVKNREKANNQENMPNDTGNILDIVSINKLTKENASFYITKGGFIGLKENDEDKGRVWLFRMTPITSPTLHISVRDLESKEIGIIFDINEFSDDQRKIMEEELNLRYLTPEIKEITQIKEEYGYTFITAETSAGRREFTLRDLSNNIIFLTNVKALLIDTDGNRYLVENVKNLNDKALRIIGVWA